MTLIPIPHANNPADHQILFFIPIKSKINKTGKTHFCDYFTKFVL